MELKFSFYLKLCVLCFFIINFQVTDGALPLIPIIISAIGVGISTISMSLSAETTASRKKTAEKDKKNQEELMDKLEVIRSLVAEIDVNSEAIKGISSAIQTAAGEILTRMQRVQDLKMIQEFFKNINYIDRRYERDFLNFAEKFDNYENSTIENFVREMIEEREFRQKLDDIVDAVAKTDQEHLFNIVKVLDVVQIFLMQNARKFDCGTQSLYDYMYGLYNLVIGTMVKGYTMIGYAYNFDRRHQGDPTAFKQEKKDVMQHFKDAAVRITKSVRSYVNAFDDIKYKQYELCDAKEWKEDENYFTFKKFLALYMWPYHYDEPSRQRAHEIFAYPQNYCENNFGRRCSYHKFRQICLALPESGRRYWSAVERLNYDQTGRDIVEISKSIGIPNQDCVKKDALNDLSRLTFKACICDEKFNATSSVRSFSLRVHQTDVANHRVATGIRFRVRDNLVTLELQEGTLMKGRIDPKSLRWNEASNPAPDGADSVMLDWNMRSLEMDNVVLPKGEFLTGVKFVVDGDRVVLKVAGTKIYDNQGYFIPNPEITWRSSLETRQRFNRTDVSDPNGVQFDVSNWVEDFSQTTVPFFDSRELTTRPPVPLGGVGIHWKVIQLGVKEFISLKATSADHNIMVTDAQLEEFRHTDFEDNFISENY